jgi:hypothetical protein
MRDMGHVRDVREAWRGPGAELGERGGTADDDYARDERDDACRLERELARGDLDPVTEHQHAEQYPDERLPR